MTDKTIYCSFCGKSQHDVAQIVAGKDAFICNECVRVCVDVIDDSTGSSELTRRLVHLTETSRALDRVVRRLDILSPELPPVRRAS
ncbi:ClpX C4-type zinc finger protein [Pseudochelatococcus sp. B33]